MGTGKSLLGVLVLDILKKALLFTLLLLLLTAVENVIVGYFHGEDARHALKGLGGGTRPEALATALLMFLILIPYFAYRDIAAKLGEETLSKLLYHASAAAKPGKRPQTMRPSIPPCRKLCRSGSRLAEPLPETASQILDVLPGDAARARAARHRPFQRLGAQPLRRKLQPVIVRRSPSPCRGSRPGCNCGSRSKARSGPRAKPSPRPPRPELIAVARSFSIISRGMRWRRFEVA